MTAFAEKVYKVVAAIPEGKVSTYKEVAKAISCRSFRAVGQALKRNPNPVIMPCHRVVRSDGGIGGYSGSDSKQVQKKIRLLESEGIEIKNGGIELGRFLHRFGRD